MKNKISLLLVLILILGTVFYGCNSTNDKEKAQVDSQGNVQINEQKKDTLTYALYGEPSSLDPQCISTITDLRVINNIFDTLITIDKEGNIAPGIAESWELLSDTEIKFTIKQGIKFHNGESLTNEDVAFTINRAVESPYLAGALPFLEGAEVIDDTNVLIKFKSPTYYGLKIIAQSYLGIVSKKAAEETGDSFKLNPIGSGPYKFVEWISGDKIVLERYEDYYDGAPPIKNLVFRVIIDNQQRVISLETGELDMVSGIPKLDYDNYQNNDKITTQITDTYSKTYIGFNMQKEHLNNKLVRQAINYAINKDEVLLAVMDGVGKISNYVTCEGLEDFPDVNYYEYNIDKAKESLEQAGYADGLQLKLQTFENPIFKKIAQTIQGQLAKVGIEVEIEVMEMNAYLQACMTKNVDIFIMNVNDSIGLTDSHLKIFESTQVYNFAGFASDEVDRLLKEAEGEFDPNKRKVLYTQAVKIIKEEAPIVPLYFTINTIGYNADLKGVEINPVNVYRFNDFSY